MGSIANLQQQLQDCEQQSKDRQHDMIELTNKHKNMQKTINKIRGQKQ
jgi:hypothetical protein